MFRPSGGRASGPGACPPSPSLRPQHCWRSRRPRLAATGDGAKPAGGAETGEVVIATIIGLAAALIVLVPIVRHRDDRMPGLGRLADGVGKIAGLPGWAALPLAIQGGALVPAKTGFESPQRYSRRLSTRAPQRARLAPPKTAFLPLAAARGYGRCNNARE